MTNIAPRTKYIASLINGYNILSYNQLAISNHLISPLAGVRRSNTFCPINFALMIMIIPTTQKIIYLVHSLTAASSGENIIL